MKCYLKIYLRQSSGLIAVALLLWACHGPKKWLNDKVILQDGSSITGTVTKSDSLQLKITKMDESEQVVQWAQIDSVAPLAFRTRISSISLGLYNTPYYSVFRNENFAPSNLGLQFRTGMATFGKKYNYFHFTLIPSQPFRITKLGYGIERYKRGTYMDKKNLFLGFETNLIFIRYNNAPQFAFEPFVGKQWKYKDQWRIHGKIALQLNVGSRNSNAGIYFGVGMNYLKQDFKKKYQDLNQTHSYPSLKRKANVQ